MLEEKGIVGPGEGAKPREVYGEASLATVDETPAADEGFSPVDTESEEEVEPFDAAQGKEKKEEV